MRSFSVQINDILAAPQMTGEELVSEEEEQFSILPIDPVEDQQVVLDTSKIILGKNQEQVEEAMSIALSHEEL